MRIPLFAACVAAGIAASAAAQTPPLAAEFPVNAYTTGDQGIYGAAMDRRGNFVFSWDSELQDAGGYGVFVRRFDETQTPTTGDLQVNTFTTGAQRYPNVGMDDSGRFVVVWASPQDGSSDGVFARRFDADGNPLSAEIPINTYTTGAQTSPTVGLDPSGNFVVAWTSEGQDGNGNATVARRFDQTGAPLGAEFVVNTFTTGAQYAEAAAVDGAGNFVIVWTQIGGASYGIFARRYDSAGNALSGQFQVDTTSDYNGYAVAAADRAGNFVVVWSGDPSDTGNTDILARGFDPAGAPYGDEFVVNQSTTGYQRYPSIAMDKSGNFAVAWRGFDADGDGMMARRYDTFGAAVSDEFGVNATTALDQKDPFLAVNNAGDLLLGWHSELQDGSGTGALGRRSGLATYSGAQADVNVPAALSSGPRGASNLNGVIEAGETTVVEPTWTNRTAGGLDIVGTATDFSGPAGATYTLGVPTAIYGPIAAGGSANCYDATGICYVVTVSTPAVRPAQHWDAQLQEQLDAGVPKTWALHIGGSFPDVPQNAFYPFIENLFHSGVTGGCAGGGYCPLNNVTRAQMAVFLLKSKFGSTYLPPPATGTVFTDVPASNPFAPWIENLAALGITGGCGSGIYCPNNPVTRQQMAIFLLKTKYGSTYAPPTGTGIFGDVSCPGIVCDFIEDLYSQGITGGCQASPLLYCPGNTNLRQQMAVFLVKTFGLQLYGPD